MGWELLTRDECKEKGEAYQPWSKRIDRTGENECVVTVMFAPDATDEHVKEALGAKDVGGERMIAW